ncbi:uncharacterized protein LOC131076157 [Cryptomeria japonica]|uniref:uncharacterized protein LOC131076157 n=1 Tax=Cryptomeria japonica TaxID=3369 RepID=UPI0027DA6156|nr:uncharacterized protein LOC131076157 [Cryptomeria japonica]
MDFIGEIVDKSSGGHKWILVAIDYFTKWIEAIPTKNTTRKVVIEFLMDSILTRFGVPIRLVVDNSICFGSKEFKDFCATYGIEIFYSALYHPQGNGWAKSSNKSILKIIKRMLEKNKKAWNSKLKFALWADRLTIKKAIGKSPFELVYGSQARIIVNNLLPIKKFMHEYGEMEDSI